MGWCLGHTNAKQKYLRGLEQQYFISDSGHISIIVIYPTWFEYLYITASFLLSIEHTVSFWTLPQNPLDSIVLHLCTLLLS